MILKDIHHFADQRSAAAEIRTDPERMISCDLPGNAVRRGTEGERITFSAVQRHTDQFRTRPGNDCQCFPLHAARGVKTPDTAKRFRRDQFRWVRM